MKVCVVSSTVFAIGEAGTPGLKAYGGLEQLAWEQARGLAARGHQVILVAPNGSECPGCEVVHTGPPGQHDEHGAFQSFWKRLFEVDVCLDNSWSKEAYLLKEEGVLKAPVLGITHAPVNTMMGSLPNVEKPCFVCISKDQCNHFEALWGRPARWVANGIDVDFYKPLNVPRSDRALFLARWSSIKGPDLGIEACKLANVGLDLIGDLTITNEPEYFQRCMAMTDNKQIKAMGGVPRGETVWWYSQANVMLHPNQRFREPAGLAPREAMACGCPCAAWRYGAMPESIVHGETGWIVNSLDELVDVIKGPASSIPDSMRTRCREWVCDQFSIKHMVDGYERLCEEAVSTGGW